MIPRSQSGIWRIVNFVCEHPNANARASAALVIIPERKRPHPLRHRRGGRIAAPITAQNTA
jgi:hypothetical protein